MMKSKAELLAKLDAARDAAYAIVGVADSEDQANDCMSLAATLDELIRKLPRTKAARTKLERKRSLKADLLAKLEAAQDAADAMAWASDSAATAEAYTSMAAILDELIVKNLPRKIKELP